MTKSDKAMSGASNSHSNTIYTAVATSTVNGGVDEKQEKQSAASGGSWLSRRTSLEKALLILVTIACAVAIVMVIVAATRSAPITTSDNGSGAAESSSQMAPCLSATCVRTSSRMLEALDLEVDPCDDFFEYACGTWNKQHVIPDDRHNYNTFGKLRDELQVALKTVLEEPVTDEDVTAVKHAKYTFQSCRNTSLIEERGDGPLRTLLLELDGWPILDSNWDSKPHISLVDLMARLRLLDNRVLINQWVSPDEKDSSVNIISLDQARLALPSRDYFLKDRSDKTLVAYQTFATNIAIMLGANADTAATETAKMVDFEVALANITIPDEARRDYEKIYHRYTVNELYTNITDRFNWTDYLARVFDNVSMTISLEEEVVVYAPVYMRDLVDLLNATDNKTLANYMVWVPVKDMVQKGAMPFAYSAEESQFNSVLLGTDTERARWRSCVNYVNENFGMALGRMFVKRHFDENAKSQALAMIQDIREAFNELLTEVPWMDDVTRSLAREKADAIREKIGYPDYILNDTALNMDYEGVEADPAKYFENVLNNLNVNTRNGLKTLRKKVDKTKWSTTPALVNAFYSSTKNQIMFPAGILQPPFYHESYPRSINMGAIAMVIGHEITHGFDDKGRQFDKDGNLKQWWSDSVITKFKERTECIIAQYDNYTVPEVGINLNGRQTQGENIADNGGLKQAFRAYRKWVKKRGHEEAPLPGLNLSHNQLFFLNFAQIWCGTARPESYIRAITSGRHSPGRFRVIGSLSNSVDFAEAYNCPIGSKMNPEKKCSVW